MGKFKPGQSGNPGGRPKKTDEEREVEALARQHCPRAIERLAELMDSDNDSAAMRACAEILDRGYGKPHQTQDTNVTMGVGEAFIDLLRMVHERRAQDGTVAEGVDTPSERSSAVRH